MNANHIYFLENYAIEIKYEDHPLASNKWLLITLSGKFENNMFPIPQEDDPNNIRLGRVNDFVHLTLFHRPYTKEQLVGHRTYFVKIGSQHFLKDFKEDS